MSFVSQRVKWIIYHVYDIGEKYKHKRVNVKFTSYKIKTEVLHTM